MVDFNAVSAYYGGSEHTKNTFTWTNILSRNAPFPIEEYSIFGSYGSAVQYAANNALAYEGQVIAVADPNLSTVTVYVLDRKEADGLKELATDHSIQDLKQKVNNLSVEIYEGENGLSAKLHKEITDLRTDSFSGLSIDLNIQETPTSGSQRTYVLSQGGTNLSTKIEIPQDRVIKSAYVVYVSAETSANEAFQVDYNNGEIRNRIVSVDTETFKLYDWDGTQWIEDTVTTQVKERFDAIHAAYTDPHTGGEGSYIRMEIAGTEGTVNTPVVYVPVPGLANSYIGATTDTISVEVEEGRSEQHRISAIVRDGSIGEGHLTTSLSNAIKDAVHFRGIGTYDDTLKNDATWAETSATLQSISWYSAGNSAILGDLVIKIPSESEFVFTNTGVWKEFGSGTEISAIKQSISNLSTELKGDISLSVTNILCALDTERTTREGVESEISGKVDNKIKVGTGTYLSTTVSNVDTLSVVKIADEDYYRLVAEGKQNNDVLYVVSSDYVNGHDQRIINVGAAISATDAVNLSGMTAAIDAAKSEIVANALSGVRLNGQDFTVEGNVAILEISCIDCGGAV